MEFETASLEAELGEAGIPVFQGVSAATRNGVDSLMHALLEIVLEERHRRSDAAETVREETAKAVPVLRPHLQTDQMSAYGIETADDGTVRVTGARLEQFTVMTDFENENAINRFQDVLEKIGLRKTLLKADTAGNPVFIGKTRVNDYL